MPRISNRLRRNYGRSAYPTKSYMNRPTTKGLLRHPLRGPHIAAATIGQAFRRHRMIPKFNRLKRWNTRAPLLRLARGAGNLGAVQKLPHDVVRDILSYL